MVKIHFSDFFQVSPRILDDYGAFNISLLNDLPLFIDPFLIFNSQDPELKQLHENIIKYVEFLRDKSVSGTVNDGLLDAWFVFKEVKQTWLGFSKKGNKGSGLGRNFANNLHRNLKILFSDFGREKITLGSHIERFCLIEDGVGKDNISDFTTTLIKDFLAKYTQEFAKNHIDESLRQTFSVSKTWFNYDTEAWVSEKYDLPYLEEENDYILLTPKRLLTRENLWLDKDDMVNKCLGLNEIGITISDSQLRAQVNNYFQSVLPIKQPGKQPNKSERKEAVKKTIKEFPILVNYYIRQQEDAGHLAKETSEQRVSETEHLFVKQIEDFIEKHLSTTDFYQQNSETFREAYKRLMIFKNVIEENKTQWLFYVDGKPISTQDDLYLLFKLIWQAKNNKDMSIAIMPEIKLASNKQIKNPFEKLMNFLETKYPPYLLDVVADRLDEEELKTFCFLLKEQYGVDYENFQAQGKKNKFRELIEYFSRRRQLFNLVNEGIKYRPDIPWEIKEINEHLLGIVYFSINEYERIVALLKDYKIRNNPNIVLIDGRKPNP